MESSTYSNKGAQLITALHSLHALDPVLEPCAEVATECNIAASPTVKKTAENPLKTQPACPVASHVQRQSASSVLNFIAAYQTRADYQFAELLPILNAKVASSRPISAMCHEPKLPQISKELISSVEQMTKPFTCTNAYWTKSLSNQQSNHVFIVANTRSAVQQYLRAKVKHAQLTAVLAIPYKNNMSQLLSKLTLLKTVRGSELYPSLTNHKVFGLYTDCSDKVVKFSTQSQKAVIPVTIAGVPTSGLLDSGATGTAFISDAFCKQHGLSTVESAHLVKLGDERTIECNQMTQVSIRIGHIKFQLECLVIPGTLERPLILGFPWWEQFVTNFDPQGKVVTIAKGHRKVNIQLGKPSGQDQVGSSLGPEVLSEALMLDVAGQPIQLTPTQERELQILPAKKLCRMIRKDQLADLFLLMVNPDDESGELFQAQVPGTSLPELKLRVVLEEHKDVFRTELPGISQLPNIREVIPTVPGSSPPKSHMFRYSPAELAEMKRQITELFNAGLIEKSTSPFGSPVLFAKKKDGTLRMCVDYRC